MTDTSLPTGLPNRYERPSAMAFLGYAAAIAIILWSFAGAGFSIEKVISSPPRFADFLDRAFPPNIEPKVLTRLGWKMLETLQIAFAGAVIGIILSVPVSLLAARGLIAPPWINQIVRTALGFVRAVPDIAWALVFVVAVGLGPFAGMLAIAIDTIGFCGRFFADDMEAADKGRKRIDYHRVHRVLAEGSFVLCISEGNYRGVHCGFYDLFRLANGKVAEHWDTTAKIAPPSAWKNNNGKF